MPISICHAVSDNALMPPRWNKRLDSTTPIAQQRPPAIASMELFALPMPSHGSSTMSRPQAATPSPSQSRAPGRSLSSSQASSTTQNGIV